MRKNGEQKLAGFIRSSGEQSYIMSRWKSMARKRIAFKCVDCGSDELVKEGVFYKFYNIQTDFDKDRSHRLFLYSAHSLIIFYSYLVLMVIFQYLLN